MKVLVRFKGDNDFGHIMRTFGQLLLPKVQAEWEDLTPQNIANWFNAIAYTLYEMDSHQEMTRERRIRMEAYLKISPEDVYINVMADAKLATAEQWANYDSVVINGSDSTREKVYLV
jgi:hypothetical protein